MQLDLAASPSLQLHGKGRKKRVVPLWTEIAQVLRAWFRELGSQSNGVAFPSARGQALSRDGVDYILRQAVIAAATACPSLTTKKVSPHVLRHSTAMHLFQAGVDMAVIALWLGHESPETTHVYVEADLATKERAAIVGMHTLDQRRSSKAYRVVLTGAGQAAAPIGPVLVADT